MASYDPSGLFLLVCLEASGVRKTPLNCHLPRNPLMLFLFLENFLVPIDLIAWMEGWGQNHLCETFI